ncbi:serine hydrolase FSH [Daldinia decipiens]|uniref:serine hydrolase FSH n=1 Tax=Daldinia decipiens TaxID=326647 RepID=UPI0020C3501A|nr:serine hydrolase FSH [Daldinia decipiens]KAI1662267.1 serine hydrolase FSH [Daldinia decipiens]
MHFLCLHGAGTNSKIFEFQIAALRYELGGDHTYDFVEGVVAQDRAPGIENLATSEDLCFAYYKPHSTESFKKAVDDLEKYIKTDGPFDGIIAFSQGVSLACAILIDELRHRESGLRCGIFFSGRPPFIDAGTPPTRYSHTTPSKTREGTINIPTVHIWGAEDKIEPGQALALSRLCSSDNRYEYIHGGGHEVPGSRDKEGLIESVNVIRCMLTQLGRN